jgi:hypothetical protein
MTYRSDHEPVGTWLFTLVTEGKPSTQFSSAEVSVFEQLGGCKTWFSLFVWLSRCLMATKTQAEQEQQQIAITAYKTWAATNPFLLAVLVYESQRSEDRWRRIAEVFGTLLSNSENALRQAWKEARSGRRHKLIDLVKLQAANSGESASVVKFLPTRAEGRLWDCCGRVTGGIGMSPSLLEELGSMLIHVDGLAVKWFTWTAQHYWHETRYRQSGLVRNTAVHQVLARIELAIIDKPEPYIPLLCSAMSRPHNAFEAAEYYGHLLNHIVPTLRNQHHRSRLVQCFVRNFGGYGAWALAGLLSFVRLKGSIKREAALFTSALTGFCPRDFIQTREGAADTARRNELAAEHLVPWLRNLRHAGGRQWAAVQLGSYNYLLDMRNSRNEHALSSGEATGRWDRVLPDLKFMLREALGGTHHHGTAPPLYRRALRQGGGGSPELVIRMAHDWDVMPHHPTDLQRYLRRAKLNPSMVKPESALAGLICSTQTELLRQGILDAGTAGLLLGNQDAVTTLLEMGYAITGDRDAYGLIAALSNKDSDWLVALWKNPEHIPEVIRTWIWKVLQGDETPYRTILLGLLLGAQAVQEDPIDKQMLSSWIFVQLGQHPASCRGLIDLCYDSAVKNQRTRDEREYRDRLFMRMHIPGVRQEQDQQAHVAAIRQRATAQARELLISRTAFVRRQRPVTVDDLRLLVQQWPEVIHVLERGLPLAVRPTSRAKLAADIICSDGLLSVNPQEVAEKVLNFIDPEQLREQLTGQFMAESFYHLGNTAHANLFCWSCIAGLDAFSEKARDRIRYCFSYAQKRGLSDEQIVAYRLIE